jgi:hypothetical protein
MVDGKVINHELVWRNAELVRAEGRTGILLRIRTGLCWLPPAPRYRRIRYDNFMFIENKSFIRICMVWDLNKSRISEEHH